MKYLYITKEDIQKVLNKLKENKSPGMDKLSPKYIKELSSSLLTPLQHIFALSLLTGKVPTDWKKAQISAIYKKGGTTLAGNYRPVSLTSIISKVMETLVRNHIMNYMFDNSLFSNKQFGFLPGRSTVLQLLNVLDEWTQAIDSGNFIDCIYMDYQKAFDKVPHMRLLNKLNAYHFHNSIINWAGNFLSDRTQQVKVNNKTSDWAKVTSGIPQGSVLGPMLFVIFINDMPQSVNSNIYLFADDTKIFKPITGPDSIIDLQRDLTYLENWSDTWLLKCHPSKCKHMQISKSSCECISSYIAFLTSQFPILNRKKI